jgi:YebC/PmpR family DNA-binding regulatory protein
MAGHSKFKNIMHRKGAQDAKRAKLFTKIVKEIVVAAKLGGGDPHSNPRLRSAMAYARTENMPKDRIEGAIKKATSSAEGDNYEEIRYEGYAPGGVAVIVETLSDNRNRTAAEVRSSFNKLGGSLGETGSVSYMFNRCGAITYPKAAATDDAILEAALEAGATDCNSDEEAHEILCSSDDFNEVREVLNTKFGDPVQAEVTWHPHNYIELDEETKQKVSKLIEALEDSDDVQKVSCNAIL